MISTIEPIAAGNAIRIFLQPPATAKSWRILRKTTDSFVDQNDPTSVKVFDGDEVVVVDTIGLINEIPYFYKPFYFDGTVYTAGASQSGTPAARYGDLSVDVLSFVRERIELGLKTEIKRGTLIHKNKAIPVFTAPPVFEESVWPLVTVHLQNDAPGERALGEVIAEDTFDSVAGWTETEGWLANVSLQIIGWAQNPDERIALRQALKRIIIANLPVFDSKGIVEPAFSQQDTEDFSSYNAPVYQCVGTFTCIAPTLVGANFSEVQQVISTIKE